MNDKLSRIKESLDLRADDRLRTEPQLFALRDVYRIFDITRATIDGYIRRGQIPRPRHKIAGQRALTLEELENLAYLRKRMGK